MRQSATRGTLTLARKTALVRAKPDLPVWLLAVLLLLGTVAIYWPAMRCDFVNYDDQINVTANFHVQNGLTWESMKWAWSNPLAGNWYPLTVLSHMLDCQLFGLKPWGHHLTSVLLHALNAGLVFALLQRMTGAAWRSLLVAALFALHPLRVESVAWVSERKDVLSGFFGLLALLAYARYAQGRMQNAECRMQNAATLNPQPATRNAFHVSRFTFRSCTFYLLSLFLFALGLMSKPMLVTWPFVLLLLDYWPLGRMEKRMQNAECRMQNSEASDARYATRNTFHVSRFTFHVSLLLEKLPFFALAAAISVVTFLVQQQAGAVTGAERLSVGARVANALISYGRYLGMLFWPADLAVIYPHPGQWPLGKVLLAGGLILGLTVLVWVRRRRHPYSLMGWLWFLGTLVPVIGLVQAGAQAMADRYTYLPSLGVMVLAVWGAYELIRNWRYQVLAWSVAGGGAIVMCLALTHRQLGHWKDSEALFRYALEVTENNCVALINLGAGLAEKGQIDEAIRQIQEAVRLKPDYALAHNNLGGAFVKQGQTDKAIIEYQETIRLDPDSAMAHSNLGSALDEKGQIEEAIRQFQEAIRLKPDYADAHNNLASALLKKGQIEEAIGQYQEAVRLKPDYADAHNNLASALLKKGQIEEAIRQYQEAIRLKPDYADAHNNLGGAFAKKRQTDEAIRQFQEAIRLEPDHPLAHYNLGNALLMKGQIDEAVRQYREVIRLEPDHAEAHYNLGTALDGKGQTDEAITQYQEATRLEPGNADAHYNLGIALASKGQTEEAIRRFEAALKVKPDYPEAHNHLGLALGRKGQTDEAIRQFQEALRLKPDYVGARQNLDAVLAAKARSATPPGASTNR